MTRRTDPMERLIEEALIASGRRYCTEEDPANTARLDFYLPDDDLYIEVKRMHSPRIAEQTGRVANVIVAQGDGAVRALAGLLKA